MNGQKIILPRDFKNREVNVIDARWLRVHRGAVECSAVQGIVRDYPVIALITIVHRRQKRGRTQNDDKRDDDHVDPAALGSRHKKKPSSMAAEESPPTGFRSV